MTSTPGTAVAAPAGFVPDPAIGSAPGWPLVVYFHHVHPHIDHYTNVTPDSFARGLDILLRHFEPADPLLLRGPATRFSPPDRPTVLITFDDGYRDLLEHAVPLLDARGVKAVFFVCTRLLVQRSADPRADYLDWDECARLRDAGHLVASHGLTHTPLDRLTPAQARDEVVDSLGELRERLGLDSAVYAYPYGIETPVPAYVEGLGPLLAFGSVKARSRPWTEAPLSVRRTYLPSGGDSGWDGLVRGWHTGWEQR
ncbi:MAG: polysaccharide deacetylase family protein [Dactylosporangium sp.]|jgi:peptidoglycan/xylan/chitin deacetylase (PgdA/CDA1 family)|nr:polysaccharide deacetylase family protein [Dactylosporangium sp.]